MAHLVERFNLPFVAGSAMGQYVPVMFLAGSPLSETVVRAGSINDDAFGFTIATVASPGDPVAVAVHGVIKGQAGASIGAGARVGVGSTNGVLAVVPGSGLSTGLGSALGAGGLKFSVGRALKNAAAGDWFPVFINPEQII